MRAMPAAQNTHMNPNDGLYGGYLQKKKQFGGVNQHYITHYAVIPPQDVQQYQNSEHSYYRVKGTPYKDPYDKLPLKPNHVSQEMNHRLQQQIVQIEPAGVVTELAGGRVGSGHINRFNGERQSELVQAGYRSIQPSRSIDPQVNSQVKLNSKLYGKEL